MWDGMLGIKARVFEGKISGWNAVILSVSVATPKLNT